MEIMKSLVERGLAKPVSLSDISNHNYEGVPPRKVEWVLFGTQFGFETSIPLLLLQQHVNIVLSRIEGTRYSWDNKRCVWDIEWGTEPFENNYSGMEFNQIRNGKHAASIAACEAITWFPHLIEEDGLEDDDNLRLFQLPPRWSKMELRVYSDPVKECLFIHLNRMTGDRNAHWNILTEINRYFQENALFLSRS